MNADEFLQGMKDCKAGKLCEPPKKSESYTRGYATQYTDEQNKTEQTRMQNEYRPTISQ